jgi:predicted DNA-binding protein
MALTKNPAISVRLGEMSKTLKRFSKKSGVSESKIVRAALSHFFETHPTAEAVIAGVVAARTKEAAK